MTRKRRKFRRPTGKLSYRKMFVLAVEGTKTEPQYFAFFNDNSVIRVNCIKSKLDSSPSQVLGRMKKHLKENGLKKSDEAWLVVDKDQWTDEQLAQLHQWSQQADNYGLALSNPNFEFWLLLHFEDGKNISNARKCNESLKKHLPGYSKEVGKHKDKISEGIKKAIERAKEKDTPPCKKWPQRTGTTVYKLVENILKANTMK